MYTFALTMCGLIALFGFAALVAEAIMGRYVFDVIEEDENDRWEEEK